MSEKKKKKEPVATKTPISITGSYLDKLVENHPDFPVITALFKRTDWPSKVRWWLGRIMDKLEKEGTTYIQSRQDIINENSEKWDKDGSYESALPTRMPIAGKDDDGKETTAFRTEYRTIDYKEGDVKSSPLGQIDWGDKDTEEKVNEEFRALREGEIMLPLWKIAIDVLDVPKDIPPEEIKLLVPIMEIPDVDDELTIDDKEFEKLSRTPDELGDEEEEAEVEE